MGTVVEEEEEIPSSSYHTQRGLMLKGTINKSCPPPDHLSVVGFPASRQRASCFTGARLRLFAMQTSFLAKTPYRFVMHNAGNQNHEFLIMAPGDTGLHVMDDAYQQAVAFVYTRAPRATQTLDATFQHAAPQGTLEMSDHYSGPYAAGMQLATTVSAPAGQVLTPYPTPHVSTRQPQGHGGPQGPCDATVTVTLAKASSLRPK
jgi:hypothetical protein